LLFAIPAPFVPCLRILAGRLVDCQVLLSFSFILLFLFFGQKFLRLLATGPPLPPGCSPHGAPAPPNCRVFLFVLFHPKFITAAHVSTPLFSFCRQTDFDPLPKICLKHLVLFFKFKHPPLPFFPWCTVPVVNRPSLPQSLLFPDFDTLSVPPPLSWARSPFYFFFCFHAMNPSCLVTE